MFQLSFLLKFYLLICSICNCFALFTYIYTFSHTGPQRIWTAGEFEHDTRKKRHDEGGVVVPPVLLRDMQALRDYLPGMKEKYEKLSFEA